MNIRDYLTQSMVEERMAADLYRERAYIATEVGDKVSAKLWEHIADEEEVHLNEFQDRLISIESVSDAQQKVPSTFHGLRQMEKEPSNVFVTVTYQGDTTFNISDVVTSEAFDKENVRVKAFQGREAKGEYHY